MALNPSLEEQRLVEAALERRFAPLEPRERQAETLLGGAFAFACALLLLAASPWHATFDLGTAFACLLTFAIAARVHFVVGPGYTVPTQLAFIPLAFALPPALLAPAVALGLCVSQLPDVLAGRMPLGRVALTPGNAWFAIGPAALLAAAGAPGAAEAGVSLILALLATQIAVDVLLSAVRDALHGDLDVRAFTGEAWLYGVDAALTPVGFVAALATAERPGAVLAIVPLLGVIAVFAREREARMDSLAELNAAYRGTALVLGDVVEADDDYTGEHCRNVVELAMRVGERLALPAHRMRNLEFAALLHDVGKVAVPNAIINKPGALDEAEWAVVRRHTIEGQRMLDRVGGFMREVGVIVRAHHERWDGAGYPDGLAGTSIPLEARVIACCDTWNAMTTTRAYRAAMSPAEAADELGRNAGTQFDPEVVAAVLTVVAGSAMSAASAPTPLAA